MEAFHQKKELVCEQTLQLGIIVEVLHPCSTHTDTRAHTHAISEKPTMIAQKHVWNSSKRGCPCLVPNLAFETRLTYFMDARMNAQTCVQCSLLECGN